MPNAYAYAAAGVCCTLWTATLRYGTETWTASWSICSQTLRQHHGPNKQKGYLLMAAHDNQIQHNIPMYPVVTDVTHMALT